MKRIVWYTACGVWVILVLTTSFFGTRVEAQRGELTEGEYFAVWDKKAGEVNIAFRDGAAAFDAVTQTLGTLAGSNPAIASAAARDIARNLGVIGLARDLSDDAIEDREAFREFQRSVNSLPFSDADRQTLIDSAKAFSVVTEP